MPFFPIRRTFRPALLALPALALAVATTTAGAADTPPDGKRHGDQRLVVRGEATAVEGPCDARVCALTLSDGSFRGAPVGAGAYTGSIQLKVAKAFPNGEGGICAPLKGRIVLGAGTRDRLVLAVWGDSCQDGGGPLPEASFTGVARFAVTHGTGNHAGAGGTGLAILSEDASNVHRMTLVGRS